MTLAQEYVRLSQTLSTKLCHDLSDGIGAIDNCAGLVTSDDENIKNKALKLINDNIQKVIARLHFYKNAYGLSSSLEMTNLKTVKQLCDNGLNIRKGLIRFADERIENTPFSTEMAKVIMCLIASSASSFSSIAAITINVEDYNRGALSISIKTTGRNFIYNKDKVDVLSGNHLDTEVDFKNCHEYYIYYLINSQKFIFTIDHSTDSLIFKITGS